DVLVVRDRAERQHGDEPDALRDGRDLEAFANGNADRRLTLQVEHVLGHQLARQAAAGDVGVHHAVGDHDTVRWLVYRDGHWLGLEDERRDLEREALDLTRPA